MLSDVAERGANVTTRTSDPTHPWEGDAAGGWLGRWDVLDDGTPTYVVDPSAPTDVLELPDGGVGAVWHQVGNAGLTALAHAGGWTSLHTANRGVVRLTDRTSWWGLSGRPTTDVQARWLPGAAEWSASCGDVTAQRRMAAHPDGLPVLRIDVALRGAGAGDRWEERWRPAPLPLLVGALMSPAEPPPPDLAPHHRLAWRATFAASAASRRLTWALRRRVGPHLLGSPVLRPELGAVVVPARFPVADRPAARTPAWVDLALPSLFVAWVDLPAGSGFQLADGALQVALGEDAADDDGVVRMSFAVGLAADDAELRRLTSAARRARPDDHQSAWPALLDLAVDDPSARWLEREARWHVGYLKGAEQHDDHFDRRYVSQGAAYAYVHGLQGAPRDEALFAVPMSYLDPASAAEQLEVMLRVQQRDGSLRYARTGRGMATSGGIHAAPTDLPLWLLWAVTEHVWVTGDERFLDRLVPWWPAPSAPAAPVHVHLVAAAHDLVHRVGRGPHGLLRVGSGDWADPISAMVPDRAAFHRHGESTFNTGFACYVLPRAAALLDDRHPDVAEELRATADDLRAALGVAWTGRWWLRGFDGRGGALGADHLFVDGQVWPIIAGAGTDDQRRRVVQEIAARCDEPSPIGATILDRPHEVRLGMLAPGWDCNGGVWAAVNGLLAWAYATVDPALAWRSLGKQSLAAHAAAYPHIWYGIWSGPDAYNAWFGSRPGETFVQPATPMREFPIMNANAHAGPLLALVRVLGIEAEPEGVVVRDRGPAVPPWRVRLGSGLDLSSPDR